MQFNERTIPISSLEYYTISTLKMLKEKYYRKSKNTNEYCCVSFMIEVDERIEPYMELFVINEIDEKFISEYGSHIGKYILPSNEFTILLDELIEKQNLRNSR